MKNRLAKETSPYLKQHDENPVDWYPWGEEALAQARAENKPILLSIGYSACHWCHVMAHESFENEDIARLMNENFVNIKVDREERPDLDHIYQNVAQAITRGGGWPLTVFLTPDLKPFFGGTYFPPEDRYGRPGFPRVLQALNDVYQNDPESVRENAAQLTKIISSLEELPSSDGDSPTLEKLKKNAETLLENMDWTHGGFGNPPKFPNTMLLTYLWRASRVLSLPRARDAVLLTLTRMASGGINDQIGGGFSRYSVDEAWLVPHFEKMLYDNALLLRLYAEVLLTDAEIAEETEGFFVDVIEQTVGYLLREMRSPEGAFFAAQDADSENQEGKFFVWTPEQIKEVLRPEESEVALLRYGITESGNFEHGTTVLHIEEDFGSITARTGRPESEVRGLASAAARKLFTEREKRIRPGTDTKVLTGWNALMVSGLLWASEALRRKGRKTTANAARNAAVAAFEFLCAHCMSRDHRLMSTFQGGRARFNAYLDDYAFMAQAALDLARFSRRPGEIQERLRDAREWLDVILTRFKDKNGNGYFFTSDDHETLIQRPKTIYDQAIPSGTAVALEVMCALVEADPGVDLDRYGRELESQLSSLFSAIENNPHGYGELLLASLLYTLGPIAVSGPDAAELCLYPEVFQKPKTQEQGETYLICHARSCGLPLADLAAAEGALTHISTKSCRPPFGGGPTRT